MTSIKTPVNVNQRMSRWPIALILTVCYWIGAALMATLTPRGGWIDLGWPIASVLVAIPITILLWLIVMGVHFLAPALSRFSHRPLYPPGDSPSAGTGERVNRPTSVWS